MSPVADKLAPLLKKDERLLAYICIKSLCGIQTPNAEDHPATRDIYRTQVSEWRHLWRSAERHMHESESARRRFACEHTPREWLQAALELGYIELAMKVSHALPD